MVLPWYVPVFSHLSLYSTVASSALDLEPKGALSLLALPLVISASLVAASLIALSQLHSLLELAMVGKVAKNRVGKVAKTVSPRSKTVSPGSKTVTKKILKASS